MFEVAELGLKLGREEFALKERELQLQLLALQEALRESNKAVIILVSGVEGAGKGAVVNRLNAWLDTRWVETNAFWDLTEEQTRRPQWWRYWRALPARGRIGIMFGSWYTQPIVERAYGRSTAADFERRLVEIAEIERMLTNDGILLVKLWFHMPKKAVDKQLKADRQEACFKLRRSRWQRGYSRIFGRFLKVAEQALRATDQPQAPWQVIEATDALHRDYATGQALVDVLRPALLPEPVPKTASAPVKVTRKRGKQKPVLTVLDILSPDITLDAEDYGRKLGKWQGTLRKLLWQAHDQRRSVVVVLEGWDAAGKGSTIRRLTEAVDARLFKVITTAAPSDEEAAQHWLWRFWRHVPLDGYVSIYDRSWYGRVLVERVEQFAREEAWQRAYSEINLFERQLIEHGSIVVKFWLHISPEEQLRRFREREQTPWKQHKIGPDDWRNRARWDDYKLAVHDMVAHTSTAAAPWHLIPANDKKYARVDVLKELCGALKAALRK